MRWAASASTVLLSLGFALAPSPARATLIGGIELNLERVDVRTELEWFDVDDGESWDVSVGVLFSF